MKLNVLAAEVGKRLQAFREQRGLRQDDVARAARQAGLPWTRSMIVALEAGRRVLSIDEFVRLPQLLVRLGIADEGVEVTLAGKGTGAKMRIAHLTTEEKDLGAPWTGALAESERVDRAMRAVDWWRPVDAPRVEARRRRALMAAYEAAGGDLEQKVSRRSRVDPLIVALVAWETWGRSLTEERDRRVAEQAPPGTSPRAIQAIRGHTTRALLQDLEPRLAEARQRLRRKKGSRR